MIDADELYNLGSDLLLSSAKHVQIIAEMTNQYQLWMQALKNALMGIDVVKFFFFFSLLLVGVS
jgi:hypothetical protein